MNLVLTFTLFTFILFGLSQPVSAIFWGWEDDPDGTTDWSDGTCVYHETCRTYYVLWIPVNHECTTETIGCIE